ncbi:MAG: hypothetical protein IJ343_11345 [Clostridia bacterium]|nr:hypothetical protein [Clostridia bacterium]
MEMDFKNITFYPEFWIDAAIYVIIGVVLVLVSKWLWEYREERRLKKEMAEYIQRREDEE